MGYVKMNMLRMSEILPKMDGKISDYTYQFKNKKLVLIKKDTGDKFKFGVAIVGGKIFLDRAADYYISDRIGKHLAILVNKIAKGKNLPEVGEFSNFKPL